MLESIKRVGVIDDFPDGRETLALAIEDANWNPILQDEPVSNLQNYLASINEKFDAVVTDYHLRKVESYFPTDGAELASECYLRHIPSVLVTNYTSAEIMEMRKFRENLPVVLTPDEFNRDALIYGLEKCMNEFNNNIQSDRKAWRTLIRIEEIKDNKNLYVSIPGWDSRQHIAFNLNTLSPLIQKQVKLNSLCFAKVNIGNDNPNELYFKDWEF